MKKYRIVSKQKKFGIRKLNSWEIELRRSHWRERYQEKMNKKYVVYFGDDIDLLPATSDIADEYITRAYLNLLPEALSILSEEERDMIYDYYYRNLSDQKIGEKRGISSQTVCKRRYKIMCNLLNYYKKQKI